ncbi:MAG: YbaB/EbfC family nucleoid-associated protein [Gracilibacteraceae bacterium]|nr:YbaB/EbfC family nucleoid-associated protein [Gracilibacteraceae bacterium]
MGKGGFPGMGGNMNNMMKQVQKMQREMAKLQEEVEQRTVEASSGGGAVKVVANGKKEIISITIKPEVIDPDDAEMLQDLVVAAINEAMRQADEMISKEMSKITGGLNIPGGLF